MGTIANQFKARGDNRWQGMVYPRVMQWFISWVSWYMLTENLESVMTHPVPLSEESMQHMEAQIPELARSAVKRAYLQALTTSGKVLEAKNGQLIETTADGSVRVMRSIAKPTNIAIGTKRTRANKT